MNRLMKKSLSLIGPLVVAGILFSTGALVASFSLLFQFRALADEFVMVQLAKVACPEKTPDPKSCYVVATRGGAGQPAFMVSRDQTLDPGQWRDLADWAPQPVNHRPAQPDTFAKKKPGRIAPVNNHYKEENHD